MKQYWLIVWDFVKSAFKKLLIDLCYMLGIMLFLLLSIIAIYLFNNTYCSPAAEGQHVCMTVIPDMSDPMKLLKK